MSIEQEAQKDLAMSAADADGIAGGKRAKKAARPKIYPVKMIVEPALSGAYLPPAFDLTNPDSDG